MRKAVEKKCKSCGNDFVARRSYKTSDGLATYCSNECRFSGLVKSTSVNCPCCAKEFLLRPSRVAHGVQCCSFACRKEYRRLRAAASWKGGAYIAQHTGEQFIIRNTEEGRIKNYIGTHRVIASFKIGRELTSDEIVIRLNRIKLDNSPDNLFICSSRAEYYEFRDGHRPWPTKSNLSDYILNS